MSTEKRTLELLAPAGSVDSMKAAVAAGADAVYMGGSRFGARAYAENPEKEELLRVIDYVHIHGRKIYLTVNTLLRDQEMEQLCDYLRPYVAEGLDAVLVQDMGVLGCLNRNFPGLPLHASTQMTVTAPEFANLLRKYGVTRIVPARELSLAEIRDLRQKTGLEVECFVHGALCFSYSGQCLFSSLIGGRSGNRGRCAQTCRLPFAVTGPDFSRKKSFPLSMKDLMTLDFLPDLLDAGAYSLKIEGRMKSPRYTAGVVEIYRKYADLWLSGKMDAGNWQVDGEDRRHLLDLFDRGGQTDGYFRQHNGPDMIVFDAKPPFREENRAYTAYLEEHYLNAPVREPVTGTFSAEAGQPMALSLTLSGRGISAEVRSGKPVEAAKNRAAAPEEIRKQLEKTGNTEFQMESLEVHAGGGIFLPVRELNELRRSGLEALTEKLLASYRRPVPEKSAPDPAAAPFPIQDKIDGREEPALSFPVTVLLENSELLGTALEEPGVSRLILDSAEFGPETWKNASLRAHDRNMACFLAFPRIWRTEAREWLRGAERELFTAGFDGLLLRTGEEIAVAGAFFRDKRWRGDILLDSSLYTMNREAESMFRRLCRDAGIPDERVQATLPFELSGRQIAHRGAARCELPVYGRIPVMVTAQCFRKNADRCTQKPCRIVLTDRKGMKFPVRNQCRFCTNVIYNASPLSLLGERKEVSRLMPDSVRVTLTDETPEEAEQILFAFTDVFSRGGKASREEEERLTGGNFTRGLFRRGVE
ncbi:peptidase U32 family protein [Clostridium vitabionis]|uniref:peptidase U32 family protein n=1 Tax=Clostridium vitabionis TaxID=2784388 RepID=UPI00188AD943|nr:U32 family peptidase [Clostridium vitabionis]